jgi:hypothetical protein
MTYEHLCKQYSDTDEVTKRGGKFCPQINKNFTIDRVPLMYFKFFGPTADPEKDEPTTNIQINPVDWIYMLRSFDDADAKDKKDPDWNTYST